MSPDEQILVLERENRALIEALRALLSDVDFKSKAEHDARKLLQRIDGLDGAGTLDS